MKFPSTTNFPIYFTKVFFLVKTLKFYTIFIVLTEVTKTLVAYKFKLSNTGAEEESNT